MSYFLALKQIVDILYQFKILDYGILLFAVILIIYRIIKLEIYKNIKCFWLVPDFLVIGLIVIYTITIIRHPENSYNQYVKTMSAFLMYFLGRVYGNCVDRYSKVLVVTSYCVIYANLICRIYQYIYEKMYGVGEGWDFIVAGGLYYYKTDLLVGIIVASVFIYAYGKSNWFKYFTIFGVVSAIAFTTTARMGQLILIFEYVLIIFIELRTRLKKNWHINERLINGLCIFFMVLMVLVLIGLQFSKIKVMQFYDMELAPGMDYKLEQIFHSRHVIWWDSIHYFANQNLGIRTIGIDLWSETMRNSRGDRFHCLYMKMLYSVGYLGFFLYMTFIAVLIKNIRRRKGFQIKYITIAFWIMFLLISISMEGFEYTQMSWYPFIFAGAIMSKGEKVNE